MGIYFPVPIVASVLAYCYGRSIHRAWISAAITFVCVMLGGLFYSGVGQIVGVVVSALVIFIAFTLPEQKKIAREEANKAKDATQLPNEEDL